MNKPITVAREEFANKIVKIINEANLPAFIILDVLKYCTNDLTILAEKQYKADKEKYEQQLKKQQEGKKD